jgi:RNA polymerase sigma-70 factor (ECF subfamily)
VIRHKAMDHHRAKARSNVAMNQRANLQSVIETEKHSDNRPSDRLERTERASDVMAVLEELDETRRQCLEWKYLDKLSVREMATRLDLTEKAVESILYRARLEFRERFERREQTHQSSTNHFPKDPIEPTDRSSIQ